jgi:hypothetical protein
MKTSQKKFFEMLSEVSQAKPFKLTSEGYIRQKVTCRCPISAVAKAQGIKCGKLDYEEPAEKMGFSLDFAASIMYAADNEGAKLRKKLLKAVGLTEATSPVELSETF